METVPDCVLTMRRQRFDPYLTSVGQLTSPPALEAHHCAENPARKPMRVRSTLLAASVAFLFAGPSVAQAPAREDLADVHELPMAFETPHTAWGTPWYGGSIRILFFSEGRGTYARDVIELMQRFDVDADAAYFDKKPVTASGDKGDWVGGEAGHRRIRKLLERPYDCYVFNAVAPDKLPSDAMETLAAHLEKGAGLVLIGEDEADLLRPGNRIEAHPPFLNDVADHVDFFGIARGRAARLPERPDIAYRHGWEVEYDHWQQQLGRCLLWAAGREPRMQIEVAPERAVFARDGRGLGAVVRYENAEEPLAIEARCRRSDGRFFSLGEVATVDREGSARFGLPDSLRADDYFMEVWARSESGIESWATSPFSVTATIAIDSLVLNPNWGEIGDTVSGRFVTGHLDEDQTVRIELLDRRDRILERAVFTQSSADFQFPIESWMPMLLRVAATVVESGNEVASAYDYFRVTKRHRDRFNFLVWDYPRQNTLAAYAEESMARLGTTLQLAQRTPRIELAAHDIAWVPYTTRIMSYQDENRITKPMCWNDEEKVNAHVTEIAENYRGSREHGVYAYSLGDETVTKGGCRHPACLDAYRDYLHGVYDGDVAALNAAWSTTYGDFSEVALSYEEDTDEARAFAEGNYSRWYDRQAFFSANFVNLCQRFDAAFKSIDPQALTGFEGAGRMPDGDDMDLLVRSLGFWAPYAGPGDEVVRSIAGPDFPRANWMGYVKDADALLARYWRMVTRGMTGVWWWRWDNVGRWHGFLAPHLGPFPAVRELMEDTRVVRDGLGTLLMHSTMEDDGIGILYSHPSVHASIITPAASYGRSDHPRFGAYTDNHVAWHDAIRELGMQFLYVTNRMLRLGEFDTEAFKVLILSQTEAIGETEAEVLRQYVREGGTLIADVRPGLYDHHLSRKHGGVLDELFGIQRTANREAVTTDAEVTCRLGDTDFDLTLPGLRLDAGLRATTAEALARVGDIPFLLVHRYGHGQTILLNFNMASFPALGAEVTAESVADFIRSLFAEAGVHPQYEVRDEDDERARGMELVRWRNGDNSLVALHPLGAIETKNPLLKRSPKQLRERTVSVTLPRARHVYPLHDPDPAPGSGPVSSFKAPLRPGRARFFALTGETVARPRIFLEPSMVDRGRVVTAHLQIPSAGGKHALRVTARTPSGEEADWLRQVVIANRDGTRIPLPIAFNDPPGSWSIEVTDLFTNYRSVAELNVR